MGYNAGPEGKGSLGGGAAIPQLRQEERRDPQPGTQSASRVSSSVSSLAAAFAASSALKRLTTEQISFPGMH